MTYKKELVINGDEARQINTLLHSETPQYADEPVERPFLHIVHFNDSVRMDISLNMDSDDYPYAEAYLFTGDRGEYMDCDTDIEYFKTWRLTADGNEYIVDVIAK